MKKELIVRLHASFEQMIHVEQETVVGFWLARDLQQPLGYQTWRSFVQVVQKAITACQNSGYDPNDHFAESGKMISFGKEWQWEWRYAPRPTTTAPAAA